MTPASAPLASSCSRAFAGPTPPPMTATEVRAPSERLVAAGDLGAHVLRRVVHPVAERADLDEVGSAEAGQLREQPRLDADSLAAGQERAADAVREEWNAEVGLP